MGACALLYAACLMAFVLCMQAACTPKELKELVTKFGAKVFLKGPRVTYLGPVSAARTRACTMPMHKRAAPHLPNSCNAVAG